MYVVLLRGDRVDTRSAGLGRTAIVEGGGDVVAVSSFTGAGMDAISGFLERSEFSEHEILRLAVGKRVH